MSIAIPSPDRDQMHRTLDVLHGADGVVELRVLFTRGRKRTVAGYYDSSHRGQLIDKAIELNSQGAACYITLNALDPQLLARYNNRVQDYAESTAADSNITGRRWLFIDFDPKRPKDTAATEQQKKEALARVQKAYAELRKRGWPAPLVADSGNGNYLLYRIDLPNDDASKNLLERCLKALAATFDDSMVKIDTSVANAARIIRLIGSVNTKGDNVPSAPWRLSRFTYVPEQIATVSVDLLHALAGQVLAAGSSHSNGHDHHGTRHTWTETEVQAFLVRGGLEAAGPDAHGGALRWKLKRCPFNPDHGPTESAVFLNGDGRLGFKCQHNSCMDKHWSDLRTLVDGPREFRTRNAASSSSRAGALDGEAAAGVAVAAEPTPLVRSVPPPSPYPIDALGPVLAPAARAIAELVQVPDALAAGCVLATAALAAQAQANVQTLGGARPLSLYVLTVAGSGDRKTAADDVALAPIREYVKRKTLAYQTEMREYEQAAAARKVDRSQARKEAKSGDEYARAIAEITEGPPPRRPWLICSEPTAEGLMRSLADGQYAQGIYTDEGGQFLGGHALSEEAELRTVAMLSRAWQGTQLDRVRATDHEHLVLYGRRLSMHLLSQPEVATRLLGSTLYRSQGFLARWLVSAPESLAGTRRHDPSRPRPDEDPRIRRYWDAIGELLARPAVEDHELGGLDPPCLALWPEARSLLISAYDAMEAEQKSEGELEAVREWASKAAEHACRIAGVLTLAGDAKATAVPVEAMRNALDLMRHYLEEYMRLVGSAGVSAEIHHAQMLLAWLQAKSLKEVTARRVMQYGPGSIRSADIARTALRTLAEHGWLSTDDQRTYVVHAAAFKGDAP